jgi:hypothetical protein
MLARLDNLPQRHRSVTPHAAASDLDFRTPMRCERIPGRYDPCSRNFPSHACHAKPPAIGISLAEIAGIINSWQRPTRAGPRDWHIACGNCGNCGNPHEESSWGFASALPERGRRACPERCRRVGGGSGNCGNPLGCRYGRCFSNAVAGTGGVAESAETPYGDSSRGFWHVTGHGTVRQSVLASLRSSAAGGNP